MHSTALTSMVFQYGNTAKSIMLAIASKPDDQAEWLNILQKMFHLRQALACSICGKFVTNPYTPVQEACHCVCVNCKNSFAASTATNTTTTGSSSAASDSNLNGNQQLPHIKLQQQQQLLMRHNCLTCRNAFQIQDGFELNKDLTHPAIAFVNLCKLLVAKDLVNKWSNLQVSTQNGPITFGQLIQEGSCSEDLENDQNLGDKFRKKIKEKEHHCRCGSGAKKNNGKSPGSLTCLGQRCACYKDGKGCFNCKCLGCKNSHGKSSNT